MKNTFLVIAFICLAATSNAQLRVSPDGNIGIKTTSPRGALDVSGGDLLVTGTDNNGTAFVTSRAGVAYYGNNSYSNGLAISPSGKVGIGTNDPTAKFNIVGSGPSLFRLENSLTAPNNPASIDLVARGNNNASFRCYDGSAFRWELGQGAELNSFALFNGTVSNYAWSVNRISNDFTAYGKLGLAGAVPTHTFTLPSTATGIVAYNTVDQTKNYERVKMFWDANTFNIRTEKGDSGYDRNILINGVTFGGVGWNPNISAPKASFGSISPLGVDVGMIYGLHARSALSSGSTTQHTFINNVNQSGTASYSSARFVTYEQTIGSGRRSLFEVGKSSGGEGSGTFTPMFNINGSGNVSVGTSDPTAKLTITGASTRANDYAIEALDSAASSLLKLRNDGLLFLGNGSKLSQLIINSTHNLSGIYSKNYGSGEENITNFKDFSGVAKMTFDMSSGRGLLGINTTAPTHPLTLSASSMVAGKGIALYSTDDQTTNYQRLNIKMNSSNIATYDLQSGGTGTAPGYHSFQVNGAIVFEADALAAYAKGLNSVADNMYDIGRLESTPYRFRSMYLGSTAQIGLPANTPIAARMHLGASTTALPSVRMEPGVAPAKPVTGDIWRDSAKLNFYNNTVSIGTGGTEMQSILLNTKNGNSLYNNAVAGQGSELFLYGGNRMIFAIGGAGKSALYLDKFNYGVPITMGAAYDARPTANIDIYAHASLPALRLRQQTTPTTLDDGAVWWTPNALFSGTGSPLVRVNGVDYVIPLHQNNAGGIMSIVNLQAAGNATTYGYIRAGQSTYQQAHIIAGASTTVRACLNLADGVAPTSPNDGDIWRVGSDIFIRVGGVTKKMMLTTP